MIQAVDSQTLRSNLYKSFTQFPFFKSSKQTRLVLLYSASGVIPIPTTINLTLRNL